LNPRPKYADAYSNLGNALQKTSDLDGAIESYKKAVKIKPKLAEAHNNLGAALHERGDLNAAIDSYKNALKIKPDYANANHMLASLTGTTTHSTPREYVENLFNSYALNFEESLVEK
jgi:predicted TPR repeat methyltransferase